jgi:two-component system, cell cycle sensor histidine kinase PleC
MTIATDRDDKMATQWPIAVTLVLCVLFAAVVALLVKREYDSYRFEATQKASLEAKIVAETIDTAMSSARASLIALSSSSPEAIANAGLTIPSLDAIAVFDATGQIAAQSGSAANNMAALIAAGQLATPEGWSGAVALGNQVFAPALSLRGTTGNTIVALVAIAPNTSLGPKRRIIIADASGAYVSIQPAFRVRPSSGAAAAYGTQPASAVTGPVGIFSQDPDGTRVVVGSAMSASGLVAYVAQDRSAIDMGWYRTAIMFALLFIGPMLAGAGIYFIVRGQSERFHVARTQMRDAERRLRIAIEGASCGVWDWDISEDRVYLTQRLAKTFGLEGAGRFDTQDVLAALNTEDGARLRAAQQPKLAVWMLYWL